MELNTFRVLLLHPEGLVRFDGVGRYLVLMDLVYILGYPIWFLWILDIRRSFEYP